MAQHQGDHDSCFRKPVLCLVPFGTLKFSNVGPNSARMIDCKEIPATARMTLDITTALRRVDSIKYIPYSILVELMLSWCLTQEDVGTSKEQKDGHFSNGVDSNAKNIILNGDEIKLIKEHYQDNPFITWKKNLSSGKDYNIIACKKHIIALIPFVRNIIEFGLDKKIVSAIVQE